MNQFSVNTFFSLCSVLNQFPCPFSILSLSLNTCFHCLLCVHSCFHGTYSNSLIKLAFCNSICNAFHVVVKRAHYACIEGLMWVIWKADVWNGKPCILFSELSTVYNVLHCIYIYIYIYAVFCKHGEFENKYLKNNIFLQRILNFLFSSIK